MLRVRAPHVFGPVAVSAMSATHYFSRDIVSWRAAAQCEVCGETWATFILATRDVEPPFLSAEVERLSAAELARTRCYPDPHVRAIVKRWRAVRHWFAVRQAMREEEEDRYAPDRP